MRREYEHRRNYIVRSFNELGLDCFQPLGAFYDPSFVAATGSDEELTKLTRSLGVMYTGEPAKDGQYSVDHSASIVLIAPQARLVGLFRSPLDAAAIGADLLNLVNAR